MRDDSIEIASQISKRNIFAPPPNPFSFSRLSFPCLPFPPLRLPSPSPLVSHFSIAQFLWYMISDVFGPREEGRGEIGAGRQKKGGKERGSDSVHAVIDEYDGQSLGLTTGR